VSTELCVPPQFLTKTRSPGGNAGIGKETIKGSLSCALRISEVDEHILNKALLAKNAKVYLATRDQEKAETAIRDLKVQTGKEAIFLKLDLSDLESIKTAAEEFSRFVLRPLTLELGALIPGIKQGDGIECSF
jgi:hypothetical protein